MGRIKLSATRDYFEKNGKPLFLLSDTDWMAFQKLSLDEWRELVTLRKAQGFEALQISVLPISHDNSHGVHDIEPFVLKDGKYDFAQINEDYFEKAEQMLVIMREQGLTPFLHLFWANYIPDTWAAKKSPNTVIPFELLEGIARLVVARFKKYEPIYSVSGDTNFETEQVSKYYLRILDVLHELDPEGLTTLHLQPTADPPEILCKHPQYHFYSYQSGHSVGINGQCDQTAMMSFSEQFLNKPNRKPIVNTEPCYEGHGYGFAYGRFSSFDVRRAVWSSLLSGAKAGVTYGAHGVWQMYEYGAEFNNAEFSSMPYDWHTALRFSGAWDVSYAKSLFCQYNMFGLSPSDKLEVRSSLIRMAASEDLVVIYAPYNDEIVIDSDLTGWEMKQLALGSRSAVEPSVDFKNGQTIVHMCQYNEDILFVAKNIKGV